MPVEFRPLLRKRLFGGRESGTSAGRLVIVARTARRRIVARYRRRFERHQSASALPRCRIAYGGHFSLLQLESWAPLPYRFVHKVMICNLIRILDSAISHRDSPRSARTPRYSA